MEVLTAPRVPANLNFEIEDIEDEWTYTPFDYIHGRFLYFCFEDVSTMVKNAYKCLTPDGYLELQDLIISSAESCNHGAVKEFLRYIVDGCRSLNKDFRAVQRYNGAMEEVGFVDIQRQYHDWPTEHIAKDLYTLAGSMQWRLSHPEWEVKDLITATQDVLTSQIPYVQLYVSIICSSYTTKFLGQNCDLREERSANSLYIDVQVSNNRLYDLNNIYPRNATVPTNDRRLIRNVALPESPTERWQCRMPQTNETKKALVMMHCPPPMIHPSFRGIETLPSLRKESVRKSYAEIPTKSASRFWTRKPRC